MAVNVQVSTDLLYFSPTADQNNVAEHEIAKLDRPFIRSPYQTWRSTNTSAQSVYVDLENAAGTPTAFTVGGIYLHHCNFDTVAVATSPVTPSYTTLPGSPFTLSVDPRVGRRRRWIPINVANVGHIRLQPSNVVTGEAFFELGAGVPCGTVVMLAHNRQWPVRWSVRQRKTLTDFRGGGFEESIDGRRYLETVLDGERWKRQGNTVLTELLAVIGAGGPIVIVEEFGNTAEALLAHVVNEPEFALRWTVFGTSLVLREAI